MHIIEACNEEKDVLEDEFNSVRDNSKILETRIHPEKHRVDADVDGVETQLQLQQAVLQELQSGINIC